MNDQRPTPNEILKFFRTTSFMARKKLVGRHLVRIAARHNLREIQSERGVNGHIDPLRSAANLILVGPNTSAAVARKAADLMRRHGYEPTKFRKDGVVAIEIVCSVPSALLQNDEFFFTDCVTWAGRRFGGSENIVSAVVHRDEEHPHVHVLLIPLVAGQMKGSQLGSYLSRDLLADQADFHDVVGRKHGLRGPSPPLTRAQTAALAVAVVDRLTESDDPALKSNAWNAIQTSIQSHPQPYATLLGITRAPAQKPRRNSVQIFTSPGKGDQKPDSVAYKEGVN